MTADTTGLNPYKKEHQLNALGAQLSKNSSDPYQTARFLNQLSADSSFLAYRDLLLNIKKALKTSSKLDAFISEEQEYYQHLIKEMHQIIADKTLEEFPKFESNSIKSDNPIINCLLARPRKETTQILHFSQGIILRAVTNTTDTNHKDIRGSARRIFLNLGQKIQGSSLSNDQIKAINNDFRTCSSYLKNVHTN